MTITDIDVLAFVGNKAVVLQAKSKKLTQLSRRGSEDKLKEDFKAAIQDAYDQAVICRHAILNRDHTFIDQSGRELRLEETLNEAYIICLTADNYPGLTRQAQHFLRRKANEPAPIAISLFDLDVLTFYLKDPFEFTFYQRQRAATDSYYMPENEIAILAYHLRRRLWKSPATDGESIDGSWAQRIDAHFHAVRRGHPSVKEFEDKVFTHWKNEGFTRLVQQLKQSKIPGFTDAVFQLYEMSSDALDSLIEEIEKTKQKTLKDGKRHSFSCGGGKAGISFVCRPDERMLSQDMYSLAESKKYILHADQWLSLGSIAGSPNLIDVAMYSKEPWKESADLEQLASTLKPGILQRPGGKVGRNDPCKCGSGFKYKKCCGR